MEELKALRERGFLFQPVLCEHGEITVLVGSYGYHGYYDRIHVWDEDEAVAAREKSDSRPFSGNVVWRYEGTAADCARALLELPKPGEPNAPTLAKRRPSSLWIPLLSPRKR